MRRSVFGLVALVVLAVFATATVTLAQPKGPPEGVPGLDRGQASSYSFVLEVEGLTFQGFRSISGLDSETEVIEFRSGTEDIVRKLPGRTKFANIVLKRGYQPGDDLWQWRQSIVDGEADARNAALVILDANGAPVARYNLHNAWPAKWHGPDLNAQGTDVAIETIELTVERVELAD